MNSLSQTSRRSSTDANLQPLGTTSLLEACKSNSLTAVKYWFSKEPAQIHLKHSNCNSSLLHICVQQTKPEIVEYLIKMGLNVNVRDDERRTPLHLAASNGRKDIASILIKYSAKLNVLCEEGFTPLCYAAWAGNRPMCNLLIESGALIDPPDASQSPYELAIENGHYNLANETFGVCNTC